MAGMDMGTHMAMSDAGNGSDGHTESTPAHRDTPCEQPVTTGDCQVLAPCAGGFFASARTDLASHGRVLSRVAALPTLALSSRTIPPELPPPRA